MWVISGEYYQIQDGLEKAAALKKKLVEEIGDPLEQAFKIQQQKDQADRERKIIEWENQNKHIQEKWLENLDKKRRTRNILGYLLIFEIILFLCLIFSLFAIGYKYDPSTYLVGMIHGLQFLFMERMICVLPLFFIQTAIVFLYFLLDYKSIKKKGPALVNKPVFDEKVYSVDKWLAIEHRVKYAVGKTINPYSGQNDYGRRGESNIMDALWTWSRFDFDVEFICIKGAMVEESLDADVLFVGPPGIWVLESKYIRGRIERRPSGWYRTKTYHERGGYLVHEEDFLGDIEDQWIREKNSVIRTLKDIPSINHPEQLVKGGIVFSHRNSSIYYDSPPSVEAGRLPYWKKSIMKDQSLTLLSSEQVMKVVDSLLERSRKYNHQTTRSAVDIAIESYEEKKQYWLEFIQSHGVSTG